MQHILKSERGSLKLWPHYEKKNRGKCDNGTNVQKETERKITREDS